jgi:1,4-alpha-glucan branching enzyme
MLDPSAVAAVLEARSHDPFAVLGQHRVDGGWEIRAFLPGARSAFVATGRAPAPMERVDDRGFFVRRAVRAIPQPYRLIEDTGGVRREAYDPYAFTPQLTDFDLHLFNEGRLYGAQRALGAHPLEVESVAGVRFAVWTPNAERVSVVGGFNAWDGRRHAMRSRGSSGVWEIFIPGIAPGDRYKFEIRKRSSGETLLKTDPYAQAYDLRPGNASVIAHPASHRWTDAAWLERRVTWDWQHEPLNAYEVHLGSWRRGPDGEFLTYQRIAYELAPYVRSLGYTHVELLPVSEHPLDASWGYQTTGYFAPTSRFGTPDDFRAFVDHMHGAGIGVIVDWVPAHFPRDDWALARFDGTPLYEHEDPQLGEHPDWGTYIFNYGRPEVRSFLISSALHWLEEFHLDGLRVDAVASMLYLDYSRKPGQWRPNRYGGRENLEAIDFLKSLNVAVHERCPGALTIAEESTAWPNVTRPTYVGGLGFSMKWSMGWMNDTLRYAQLDPIHRSYHHDALTFSQLYAYSENFVLPLSHDEVVHGKRSLLDKMPGDAWRKFAGVRLFATYQMTHPGKKLMFMGDEFAQGTEWDASRQLAWELLDAAWHRGVQACVRDLNRLYAELPALHHYDFERRGFEWIDCNDAVQSVISFVRRSDDAFVVIVLNFTPVPRHGYRIGVPRGGEYRELFNSDAAHYGGSNVGNLGQLRAEDAHYMGRPHSLPLTLPPLAGLIIAPAS